MEKSIDWRLFSLLLGASIFGVIAVTPYVLTLQADLLGELPIPLHVLLPISILQSAAMFAVFIYIGLRLSKRVGLGIPILEGWLQGRGVKAHLKSILGISVALGVLAGVLIIGIDLLFHALAGPIVITEIAPPGWQRFLACFYGAINEEVIMRLFLMTLLVWVFCKVKKNRKAYQLRRVAGHSYGCRSFRRWPSTIYSHIDPNHIFSSGACDRSKRYRGGHLWVAVLEKGIGVRDDFPFFRYFGFTSGVVVKNRARVRDQG